tara:strand:+ start:1268 stop:2566 length:1299 start_codon:yes stop_codon:yes gene_type:complete
MEVTLQNVSSKNNRCFYYAFLSATRNYLKTCQGFKKNKSRINTIFLKSENLNITDILNDVQKKTLCEITIKNIYDQLNTRIFQLNSIDNMDLILQETTNDLLTQSSKDDINLLIKSYFQESISTETKLTLFNKMKDILKRPENIANLFSLDITICKYFIDNNSDNFTKFITGFIEIQLKDNSYTTHLELDLFNLYITKNCSNIIIKTISNSRSYDITNTSLERTKKFIAENLNDFCKDIIRNRECYKDKRFVFLYTDDSHYRFFFINKKSIFTFADIAEYKEELTRILLQFDRLVFNNIELVNTNYARTISSKSYSDFLYLNKSPLYHSPINLKGDIFESFKLTTDKSPPHNMLRHEGLNKIYNYPLYINDLDDDIKEQMVSFFNKTISAYETIKKLQIVKRGKIYKFNYKDHVKILENLTDNEKNKLLSEI